MKQKLKNKLKNAYAPYSKVLVSACVVTEDENIFFGVNVENASFGATNCAERSAIFSAISNGYKNFKEIHLISNQPNFLYPCFICRQVINEFFDRKTNVFIWSQNNSKPIKETVSNLSPKPVNREAFEWEK